MKFRLHNRGYYSGLENVKFPVEFETDNAKEWHNLDEVHCGYDIPADEIPGSTTYGFLYFSFELDGLEVIE